MAYAHTYIYHALDPTLSGSIQHNWKCGHLNIKPEQMWARLWWTGINGFEELLNKGIQQQWYNIVNIADRYGFWHPRSVQSSQSDRLVFRWLAIPWLQQEANSYVYNHNTSRRRASCHKILPNSIPDAMFENPELVDARNFKVSWYFDQKSYVHTLTHRSSFQILWLTRWNISGHHLPTLSFTLFPYSAMNIFLQFTCDLGA